jgi:hypothetical protein
MQGDRAIAGKHKPINKRDYEFKVFCGGMGGGDCGQYLGKDRETWTVDNDPNAVVNRYLALFDSGLFEVYTDGGQNPIFPSCRLAGTSVPLYVAVSVDGNLTPAQIMAQGVVTGFGIPALLEFDEVYLPQPTDPRYTGKTYVTVYWGSQFYVTFTGGLPYRTDANLSNVET